MAFNHSQKLPITSTLCYKTRLIISFASDPSLYFYSLSSVPYPFLSSTSLGSHTTSIEWGYKKDIILASSSSGLYILKADESKLTILNKININAELATFNYMNDFILTGDTNHNVKLWSAETLNEVLSYSHQGSITGLDMSSEGDLIASASVDQTCLIFNPKTTKLIKTLEFSEHDNSAALPFFGCRFSKSGESLFTTSSDKFSYVTQWDGKNFLPITTFRLHASPVKFFTISLDGFFLGIGTTDGWVKIMNTRTMDFEKNSKDFDSPVSSISFTYDSRHLVATAGVEIKNLFNTRGEGIFSKLSKVWVVFIFCLWFYLYLKQG